MDGQRDPGATSDQSRPAVGDQPGQLDQFSVLGRQWRAAGENAFAGLSASPERYTAAGRWVAGWLELLRRLPPGPPEPGTRSAGAATPGTPAASADIAAGDGEAADQAADRAAAAALIAAWQARDSTGPGSGTGETSGTSLPLTAAERAALTAAAFAIRHGEVAGWLAARRRRRALAAAGPGWLILEEAGDPEGDVFIPYRRLEVDSASGRGVLVETRPDDEFAAVRHEVHAVLVDAETGALTMEEPHRSWVFGSAREREELVGSIRAAQPHG